MATFKISILFPIKSWTFWYIKRLPTLSYTGVTYFHKWSGFFWPTLYMGCIMYADDIILLSPSVQGLQDMLNVCYSVSSEPLLQFNPNKCHLIAFGPLARKTDGPLLIGSDDIDWTHSLEYLGVHIICGRKLSFDINPIKRAFLLHVILCVVSRNTWTRFYTCLLSKHIVYTHTYICSSCSQPKNSPVKWVEQLLELSLPVGFWVPPVGVG